MSARAQSAGCLLEGTRSMPAVICSSSSVLRLCGPRISRSSLRRTLPTFHLSSPTCSTGLPGQIYGDDVAHRFAANRPSPASHCRHDQTQPLFPSGTSYPPASSLAIPSASPLPSVHPQALAPRPLIFASTLPSMQNTLSSRGNLPTFRGSRKARSDLHPANGFLRWQMQRVAYGTLSTDLPWYEWSGLLQVWSLH